MTRLSRGSFFDYLPGRPTTPVRTARRQLAVVRRDSSAPAARRWSPVADAAAFDDAVARARAAFAGHDAFDLAISLSDLVRGLGPAMSDGDQIGWLAAAELGWSILLEVPIIGPVADPNPLKTVVAAYDPLRAAAFLARLAGSGPGDSGLDALHRDYFAFARTVRNLRFDDQEPTILEATWSGPECKQLLGTTITETHHHRDTLDRRRTEHGLAQEARELR